MRRGRHLLLAGVVAGAIAAPAVARAQYRCPPRPPLAAIDHALPLHRTLAAADSLDALDCAGSDEWRLLPWALRVGYRSGVPDPRGLGAAQPGLGAALHARVGADVRLGRLLVRAAPELTLVDNDPFLVFPGRDATRSGFASPWYVGPWSADLPSAHGTAALARLNPGESGAWLLGARTYLGATTAIPDWGPGAGEGLVLGRSAAGLPRLEAGTARTVRDVTLRATWFTGVAAESRFFDDDPRNDARPVGGLRLSAARGPLTLGVSRTVMDGRRRANLSAAFRPFERTRSDSILELVAADLLFRDERSGALAWFEAARQQPLSSAGEFFRDPTFGLALRVGATAAVVRGPTAAWHLAFEAVRLDQPRQRDDGPPQDLYTSPRVVHGWTHRGAPLGSGLGPGGQRQVLSLDRESARGRIGGFLERIRWNDDAMYREFLAYPVRHDVSVQGGVRGARRTDRLDVSAMLLVGQRLNYLFQNASFLPEYRTDDVRFVEFSLALRPLR